jgi:hypothetical protein
MKKSQKKKLLMNNGLFWLGAIAGPPLLRLIPTSSGERPRILPFITVLMLLILAGVSTAMWNGAIVESPDE